MQDGIHNVEAERIISMKTPAGSERQRRQRTPTFMAQVAVKRNAPKVVAQKRSRLVEKLPNGRATNHFTVLQNGHLIIVEIRSVQSRVHEGRDERHGQVGSESAEGESRPATVKAVLFGAGKQSSFLTRASS